MSEYLSNKFRFFSIFLCILVVIIHSYKGQIITDSSANEMVFFYIARFLSIGVGRLAIPLFFIISGYLFFKDIDSFSLKTYQTKVLRRIHSLLIPYLIISATVILITYLINIHGLGYLYTYAYYSDEYSIIYILTRWLYKPQAYHLWFIRNLFLMGLFSPILFYILKSKWGAFFILVTFMSWLFFSNILPLFTLSFVFFSLGGFISLNKIDIPKCKNILIPIGFSIFWILTIIKAIFYNNNYYTYIWDNTSIILGAFVAWTAYDFVEESKIKKLSYSKIAGFTFIIYLIHEPFISMFTNEAHCIFPSQLALAIIYIVAPLITIGFCYLMGSLLKKYAHSFFIVISGGR